MEKEAREARRALARLRRALEKARREMGALEEALRGAEGEAFPADAYEESDQHLIAVDEWANREAGRLQAKILEAGGLRG